MKKFAVSCWLLVVSVAIAAGVARAEPVEYRDYDASTGTFTNAVSECTLVTAETRTLENDWYAVQGEVVIPKNSQLVVQGTAHLVLCDGAKLSVENPVWDVAAIKTTDATLVIYGQTLGSGQLVATGCRSGAGIGGDFSGSGGTITINGGVVTATGGRSGAGIGGGDFGSGGMVTINGGAVMVQGGHMGAGIGGGENGAGGAVTINGGQVTAHGGTGAEDIGRGGGLSESGTISISGGIFWAKPQDGWMAPGYSAVPNEDEATKAEYSWAVLPPCMVTVGTISHLTVTWTSGDETVTNRVEGGAFKVKRGTETVKVIFTADDGWEIVGDAVVNLGTVTADIAFGEEGGFAFPEVKIADPCTILFGRNRNMSIAWTSGDGSVTNGVTSGAVSLQVPRGSENVRMICTADPGYELVGESVFDFITVTTDIEFSTGDYKSYKLPTVYDSAANIVYLDWDEVNGRMTNAVARTSRKEWTAVSETTRSLKGCMVVTNDVTIPIAQIVGAAVLVLCNDATLTVTSTGDEAGIYVPNDASLTITVRKGSTGRVVAQGGADCAGIGSQFKQGAASVLGAVRIVAGTVTATGGKNGAGIGNGFYGNGGSVKIFGGAVTAVGGYGAASDIGDGGNPYSPCEVAISGGVFAREPQGDWLAPGCIVVANEDAATKDDYPWAVAPRTCTVTIGEHPNLTAAYTFGDGSVTNAIEGTSFEVKWGAVEGKVKVVFIADSGYLLEGNAVVEVEFGDEDEVNIADAVPKATRWNAVVNVAFVKQRWPWNGKIDVDYALSNTAAGEYYRLITAVTVGGATQIVTNELGQVTDGNYSVMVDCAALFGEGVLAPAAVTLAVVACADDLLTIDLPFDSGDTLAYSYEGGEPTNIDLGGQSSPITFELRRNGHYDFYSNGVVTVTRDVSGLGTTMTEPNWAANVLNFMLDTQVERTFDLSAGLVSTNLTYSGTGWNETGAGTSATITFERGGQKTTLASGLTGTGEAAWSPSANGTFTWAHISGAATETATITVVNLPMVTITVGDLAAKHLTGKVVWNGSETSVSGQSFELPKGGKDAKLVLTAEEGYVVPSSQVMEIGLEGYLATGEPVSIVADIPTAVAFGVRLLGVTNRYPWNGKIDVVASVFGLDTTKCYQLVTTLTHGSTTKRVGRELDPSRDAIYTNTVDCVALFGTNVVGDVSVKLSLERCAAEQKIEIEKKFYLSGPFLILDLGGEDGKGAFTSAIYKTTAHLPNGAWSLEDGWANEYKTRYLVMRQVKAGVAYPCEPGSEGTVTKMMTPTNDYWIGVHQVTEAQYDRVMNEGGSTSTNATPKNGISWDAIRGGAGILGLPGGFMLALSNKTELAGFDLPTEAQWEIAARAGSKEKYGSYIDTKGMAETATENNVTNISWCSAWYPTFLLEKPKEVGLLRPNLWGLYDTAGNVWEWCRDGSGSFNRKDVETPAEGDSSGGCVCRGGYYNDFSYSCCPSYRFDYSTDSSYNNLGFRLARICEPEDSLFVSAANTAEIFVDEGQTFAYAIDGGELRVTEIVGPALLAFSANRNAIYTFYGITEDGAVSILGEPVIVTDAGGEKVAEASEGAVAVDTCEVKEIDGSVGAVTIDLTYSGDNWGKTNGVSATIAVAYDGGAAKLFKTGLQGEGTVTWYPKFSGTYVFNHAVAGVTESATFHAVGFPGSADNPWEVGAGDAAAVKAYVRDGYLYFAGVGEVVAFTDEAPWKEYEQLIFPLTGAVLPRTVTIPASVLATLPISVRGAQPAGAICGDFERIEIVGDEALLTVGVYTNGEITATSGWGRVQVEKADVVDGAAVLTVPAATDKGFFTLQHKENTK